MFGHKVGLNFEREGDEHRTIIGGICSSIIKIFIFIYACICFGRMIFYLRDNNVSSSGANPLVNPVDYRKTNLTIFHVLRKQRKGGETSMTN